MIIDITGIELIPGENGIHCPGNGKQTDRFGRIIECCCEECDYFLCCTQDHTEEQCRRCSDKDCPHAKGANGR